MICWLHRTACRNPRFAQVAPSSVVGRTARLKDDDQCIYSSFGYRFPRERRALTHKHTYQGWGKILSFVAARVRATTRLAGRRSRGHASEMDPFRKETSLASTSPAGGRLPGRASKRVGNPIIPRTDDPPTGSEGGVYFIIYLSLQSDRRVLREWMGIYHTSCPGATQPTGAHPA